VRASAAGLGALEDLRTERGGRAYVTNLSLWHLQAAESLGTLKLYQLPSPSPWLHFSMWHLNKSQCILQVKIMSQLRQAYWTIVWFYQCGPDYKVNGHCSECWVSEYVLFMIVHVLDAWVELPFHIEVDWIFSWKGSKSKAISSHSRGSYQNWMVYDSCRNIYEYSQSFL
jgi:hypothetical protein